MCCWPGNVASTAVGLEASVAMRWHWHRTRISAAYFGIQCMDVLLLLLLLVTLVPSYDCVQCV